MPRTIKGETYEERKQRILDIISETNGISIADIANKIRCKPQAIYKYLSELDKEGLICKCAIQELRKPNKYIKSDFKMQIGYMAEV
jgi:DeoR/GlpR family transcriptional regulator of sugar metabolism